MKKIKLFFKRIWYWIDFFWPLIWRLSLAFIGALALALLIVSPYIIKLVNCE